MERKPMNILKAEDFRMKRSIDLDLGMPMFTGMTCIDI